VNISKCLSAYPLALLIHTANAGSISIRLLDGLKGMIESDGRKRILGMTVVFFRANTFRWYASHL
jgi:hypothetical protein